MYAHAHSSDHLQIALRALQMRDYGIRGAVDAIAVHRELDAESLACGDASGRWLH